MPDRWGSCKVSKISWTIWFLFWDQLHLHLLPTTNLFGYLGAVMAQFKLMKNKFPNETTLHFHMSGFQIKRVKKCTCEAMHKWSNAQPVGAPTTTILPTAVGTCNCLNCFSHVICAPQINTYQKIEKIWLTLAREIFLILILKSFTKPTPTISVFQFKRYEY